MGTDRNEERRRRIEEAAFELLAEKGYGRTSMLQIAKKASASNETLYRWYGSKQELFRSIITTNGETVRSLLEAGLQKHDDPLLTLKALGPELLRYVADERATIMLRAAVADVGETGVLAEALEDAGRGAVFPLVSSLVETLAGRGCFELDCSADEAADTYISLLFGEVQIRQALGNMAAFSEQDVKQRADRAFDLICRLYRVDCRPAE